MCVGLRIDADIKLPASMSVVILNTSTVCPECFSRLQTASTIGLVACVKGYPCWIDVEKA